MKTRILNAFPISFHWYAKDNRVNVKYTMKHHQESKDLGDLYLNFTPSKKLKDLIEREITEHIASVD